FFFQAEDGIRDRNVTGVQTCALPIFRLRREIRALLKKVNVPAIFITHDQEEALELGDRIAVINVGHIEQIGTPYEIYNHPTTERSEERRVGKECRSTTATEHWKKKIA